MKIRCGWCGNVTDYSRWRIGKENWFFDLEPMAIQEKPELEKTSYSCPSCGSLSRVIIEEKGYRHSTIGFNPADEELIPFHDEIPEDEDMGYWKRYNPPE